MGMEMRKYRLLFRASRGIEAQCVRFLGASACPGRCSYSTGSMRVLMREAGTVITQMFASFSENDLLMTRLGNKFKVTFFSKLLREVKAPERAWRTRNPANEK